MSDRPLKKQRRKIISEDDYISTLSSIVQRDYFPEVPLLEKQAAVLDRRQAKDFKGAVAVRRAARRKEDEEVLLAEQERKEEYVVGKVRENPRPLHRETISGFHARVTSEDNHEFDQSLKMEIEEKRSRMEAAFLDPYNFSVNKEGRGETDEFYLLASDQFNPKWHRIEAPKNAALDNGFFFPPLPIAKATDSVLLINNSSDNKLMAPPQRIQRNELIEFRPKHTLEQRIIPSRTRFPPAVPVLVQVKSESSEEKDYSTEASTDLENPGGSLRYERNARVKSRYNEMETFVPMTPSSTPQATPMISSGKIESNPEVLNSAFTVSDVSIREKAARVSEVKLSLGRQSSSSASKHRSDFSRLSPAARSLLKKSSNWKASSRSSQSFSKALKKSYAPKQIRRRDLKLKRK
jgi:Nuclear protein Es2